MRRTAKWPTNYDLSNSGEKICTQYWLVKHPTTTSQCHSQPLSSWTCIVSLYIRVVKGRKWPLIRPQLSVFFWRKKLNHFSFVVGPLDVQLLGQKEPVSAGRPVEFRCQSVGARPPPTITWWRGSIQLKENITNRVFEPFTFKTLTSL